MQSLLFVKLSVLCVCTLYNVHYIYFYNKKKNKKRSKRARTTEKIYINKFMPDDTQYFQKKEKKK